MSPISIYCSDITLLFIIINCNKIRPMGIEPQSVRIVGRDIQTGPDISSLGQISLPYM